jgi:hypothetical protein
MSDETKKCRLFSLKLPKDFEKCRNSVNGIYLLGRKKIPPIVNACANIYIGRIVFNIAVSYFYYGNQL